MMTAVDVEGSAMRYCHVPDVGSKTSWITGSVYIVDAVLYVTWRGIRCLVGVEKERGENGRFQLWTVCPFCDWRTVPLIEATFLEDFAVWDTLVRVAFWIWRNCLKLASIEVPIGLLDNLKRSDDHCQPMLDDCCLKLIMIFRIWRTKCGEECQSCRGGHTWKAWVGDSASIWVADWKSHHNSMFKVSCTDYRIRGTYDVVSEVDWFKYCC